MWLEVPLPHTDYYVTWSSAVPLPHMEYSLAWSSTSEQGIYWDLKFHSSTSAYRIVCDLELWNGAIPLPHKEILWLGSYAVPLPYNKFSTTWSFAVSLPYKSLRAENILWLEVPQFRFRIRNILCLEVQLFCFLSQNNLCLEVPQFRTIYCDLNFRSSASARKDVIWNSALLLLHENITFLWKIHSHSIAHPFLNFRADLRDWWTLWRTEKQRIAMLLAKVVVNVWLREA